jgi:hypothetical protein
MKSICIEENQFGTMKILFGDLAQVEAQKFKTSPSRNRPVEYSDSKVTLKLL